MEVCSSGVGVFGAVEFKCLQRKLALLKWLPVTPDAGLGRLVAPSERC